MKPNYSFLLKLLIAQCLALACASQGYDFFYLVQQVSCVSLIKERIMIMSAVFSFPLTYSTVLLKVLFDLLISGQDHIVIRRKVVAIQQQENQHQILASTGFGPIMMMARIHPTVIPTTLLIYRRYIIKACLLYDIVLNFHTT